jgi:hypothetical protein
MLITLGKGKAGSLFNAIQRSRLGINARALAGGRWQAVCRSADGAIRWVELWKNIVVNEGLDQLLDSTLAGTAADTTWFVGLKGTGTPAAADTMASHATWSELTPYSGSRPAWTAGSVASQSVDNSAAAASFSITSGTTVYGAFLTGDASGTAGVLYAAGDFSSSRAVVNGDTLEVTATFTTADDGV